MSTDAVCKYDQKGRLTGALFNDGSKIIYNYDLAGNRTSVQETGPVPAVDDPSLSQVRVSLTSGDPWGLSDVTDGGTLYVEPIYDKVVGIWNGFGSTLMRASGFSLSLAGRTARNYRVYVWDSNGDSVVDSAELIPWIDANTPPAEVVVMDGYSVSANEMSRRPVADVYIHATGQCDWRPARRGICHVDERSRRTAALSAYPSEDTWDVLRNTTSWRRITGGAGVLGEHFVEFIASTPVYVSAESYVIVDRGAGSGTFKYEFGFGLDVTNANSATQSLGHDQSEGNVQTQIASAILRANVSSGKRTLTMIEMNATGRDITAYGDNGLSPAVFKTGMVAELLL